MTSDFFQNVNGALQAYPQTPGFKRAGTSEQAAKETAATAGTLRAAVLTELERKPQTADEVAAALRKSVLAIRPRLSELNATGKICETSVRRRNVSGKLAAVWRAI